MAGRGADASGRKPVRRKRAKAREEKSSVARPEVTVPGTEKPLMERREAPHTRSVCAHKKWTRHSVLHPLGFFEGKNRRRRTRRRKEYGWRSVGCLKIES